MVGVLALFPVASSAGRESSEETQAAILAQTIFDDLRSSTSVGGANRGWIVRGPNTFTNIQWDRTIRLTNLSTNFVVYDLIPRVNSSGRWKYSATTSRVMSSEVGPNPPVTITRSDLFHDSPNTSKIASRPSGTAVCLASSNPNIANRPERYPGCEFNTCPSSSSDPVVISSIRIPAS